MNIELTDKEFRRLLDLVYIGNWILNSTREKDRFEDYDILQEKLFAQCAKNGMNALISRWQGHIFPSPAYENGGIHEAIADYEDAVFFDILAEELARRDLGCLDSEPADYTELNARMDEYMDEFEKSGVENLVLETYEKLQSHASPEAWLERNRTVWTDCAGDFDETPYADALLRQVRRKG